MIPDRLTSPTVGLRPTRAVCAAGDTMEPSVSVPMAAAAKFAAIAAPDPELEPDGVRSSAYGFFACPPRALQPLDERSDLKLAHSLILVFASSTAPAVRSLAATNASAERVIPLSAREPAVVVIRSAV